MILKDFNVSNQRRFWFQVTIEMCFGAVVDSPDDTDLMGFDRAVLSHKSKWQAVSLGAADS